MTATNHVARFNGSDLRFDRTIKRVATPGGSFLLRLECGHMEVSSWPVAEHRCRDCGHTGMAVEGTPA